MTSVGLPFGIEVRAASLPPPTGRPVRAFLKICSKPRNLMIDRFTEGGSADRLCRGRERS